jgi:hypothetical protein
MWRNECGAMNVTVEIRHPVHRFADGTQVYRIDPSSAGEIWRAGELLCRLQPELMAVYEAALLRATLREVSWQPIA